LILQALYSRLIAGDETLLVLLIVNVVVFGGMLLEGRGDWVLAWWREGVLNGARNPNDVICILLDELWVTWKTYHY
jgi:hypothetical protein